MRIIYTDNVNDTIRQLKCHMESGQMRLTFLWPENIEYVYVFKTDRHFDLMKASPKDGILLTLHEYKSLGGYTEPRPSGAYIYRIYPIVRENGEDSAIMYKPSDTKNDADNQKNNVDDQKNNVDESEILENEIKVTGQIPIHFSIKEKSGYLSKFPLFTKSPLFANFSLFNRGKTNIITLSAQQNIANNVLCYVKKDGGYPININDGTRYFFGEGLVASVPKQWEIRTDRNEHIRIFVCDPELAEVYLLISQ